MHTRHQQRCLFCGQEHSHYESSGYFFGYSWWGSNPECQYQISSGATLTSDGDKEYGVVQMEEAFDPYRFSSP